MSEEENLDPFEEEEVSSVDEHTEPESNSEDQPQESSEESESGESKEQGVEEDEPPSSKEDEGNSESEKMIPESRFKAALKDVNDKLSASRQELARLQAQPAPDRETDPEGYEFHVRMETSKQVMRDSFEDYDQVILHYQEMAKENPALNSVVVAHSAPAKHAYDIAKKDLEVKELMKLKDSDDWKEFQEFKANKASKVQEAEVPVEKVVQNEAKNSEASKVPNLNRATDVGSGKPRAAESEDEELFAGAL